MENYNYMNIGTLEHILAPTRKNLYIFNSHCLAP